MKLPRLLSASLVVFVASLGLARGQASSIELSSDRLDKFDQRGYFTPSFKAVIKDIIETNDAIEQAKIVETKLEKNLPELQKLVSDAEAKTSSLRLELAKYDQSEGADFTALQNALKDPKSTLADQLVLAESYAWGYPTGPHQAEAQQAIQDIQKKMADQSQSEKEAEAAKVVARAELLKRVEAKQLSLAEWKSFLMDMSQQDVLNYLGRPQTARTDFWIYSGDWTVDPITQQKIGLLVGFNGSRVNIVTAPTGH